MRTQAGLFQLIREALKSPISSLIAISAILLAAGFVATQTTFKTFEYSIDKDFLSTPIIKSSMFRNQGKVLGQVTSNLMSGSLANCPAVDTSNPNSGLVGCFYQWTTQPAFETFIATQKESFVQDNSSGSIIYKALDHNYGLNPPFSGISADKFAVLWQGAFNFGTASYQFQATTDDGMRIYIDDKLVPIVRTDGNSNSFIDQGASLYTATVNMTSGTHLIKVEFYENLGYAVAKLNWRQVATQTNTSCANTPSAGTVVPNIFVGCYYDNIDFTNFKFQRAEIPDNAGNMLNFNWGLNSPDPLLGADTFSVNWQGRFSFAQSGSYIFTAHTDDGIRMYLDEKLLPITRTSDGNTNSYIDQGNSEYKATVSVAAGAHNIKVEFYENGGYALISLRWDLVSASPTPSPTPACIEATSASPANDQFTGCYFDNIDFTNYKLSRQENINFAWGLGSPDPSVSPDTFSVRWTGKFSFAQLGNYTFTAITDDGMRAWVDGIPLILKSSSGNTNSYIDQGDTQYTGTISLPAGDHLIKVEYYENGGYATAKFNWALIAPTPTPTPSPTPTSCDLSIKDAFCGSYFNDSPYAGSGSDPNLHFKNLSLTRIESGGLNGINFDWGYGSPASNVTADKFSVKWIGNFNFDVGSYKFNTLTDDGIKVSLISADGKVVIDKFFDQGNGSYSQDVTFYSPGYRQVVVEYYENSGYALAKVNWSKLTSPPPSSTFTPTLPRAAKTYNELLGVTHVGGFYSFSGLPYMEEGVDAIADMGIRTLGIWMPGSEISPDGSGAVTGSTLKQYAQSSVYQKLFLDNRFNTYLLTVYTRSNEGYNVFGGDFNSPVNQTVYNNEKNEIHDLAFYLSTTYPTKTFILKTWEGDWTVQGNYDINGPNAIPTERNIEAMINWQNARHDGLVQARNEAKINNIFDAIEFNLVRKCDINGQNCRSDLPGVLNSVVPYVNQDIVSYSSYQTTLTDDYNAIINDIKFIKSRPGFNNRPLIFSEFATGNLGTASANRLRTQAKAMLDGGIVLAVYWEIFDNVCNLVPQRNAQLDPNCIPLGLVERGTGKKTDANLAIRELVSTSSGFVAPARVGPSVHSVQGVDSATGALSIKANAGGQLVINGVFSNDPGTVVTIDGRKVSIISQSATQIKVLLDQYGSLNASVVVADSYGFSVPIFIPISSQIPIINYITGYTPSTGAYPLTATVGGYVVLYGNFAPSGNLVYVDGKPQSVTYQSTAQINILLGTDTANNSAKVTVKTSAGLSLPYLLQIK